MEETVEDVFTAICRKIGNTLYVAIPSDIARKYGLKPGSAVKLKLLALLP